MNKTKLSLIVLLTMAAFLVPNSFAFEKHGIRNVGYWVSEDQDNTLIYIVAHESRDSAKQSWKSFISDPEWKEARTASLADGPIVDKIESLYMNKTPFSP